MNSKAREKMKLLVAAALFFVSLSVAASAACTKPFGLYVGTGQATVYKNGTFGYTSIQMSISVPTSGDWKTTIWLNDLKDGTYTSPGMFPGVGKSGNSFDMRTCRGQMTSGGGGVFSYVMSDNGNAMSIMVYQKSNPSTILTVLLRKA